MIPSISINHSNKLWWLTNSNLPIWSLRFNMLKPIKVYFFNLLIIKPTIWSFSSISSLVGYVIGADKQPQVAIITGVINFQLFFISGAVAMSSDSNGSFTTFHGISNCLWFIYFCVRKAVDIWLNLIQINFNLSAIPTVNCTSQTTYSMI